jgi:hypothetical protein
LLGAPIDFAVVDSTLARGGTFLPYDRFLTERGAIYAWARIYHPLSGPDRANGFPDGSEWATWIYRDPDTSQSRRYMFGEEPEISSRGYDWVAPPPRNLQFESIAWIHTHPRPWGSENFSTADRQVTEEHNVPGFLVTPRGQVRRMSPEPPFWTTVYIDNINR